MHALHHYLCHAATHRIVSHPTIPMENKKPFTALLTWAFIETEKDSLSYLFTVIKDQ